jgi:eukaryotic-like serine/threonine-protein kinase
MSSPAQENVGAGFAGPSTPSRPATATLPPDVAREGVRRLRWVAGLMFATTVFFFVVDQVAAPPDVPPSARTLSLIASAAQATMSLAVIFLASRATMDPRPLLDLAFVYEVLSALCVSLASHVVPLTLERAQRGWSGVAVIALAYPLVIPNTRGKVVLATLATAAMDPVGLLIQVTAGLPVPARQPMIQEFAPTVVGAVLGILLSRLIFRISVEASRARELGSYRLVEPLGAGGMGEVWRAEHRMLARPAAIKLIRADRSSGGSRELQRRFEREARATARLSSPHTVQIYDYGTTDEGTFYYVMELLEGFDLDTLVRKFGPLPPERAIHLLQQACLSLAEAHQRGFTHRDIKPANIYVCHYGIQYDFVKILDFRLVKSSGGIDAAEGTLTAVGTIAGTPGYMSPEMALGRDVDSRADTYSLACVGYWLITGRPVFDENSAVELLMAHARTPAPRLSERTHTPLPKGLEEILLSCLEKDPEDRPGSVEELAAVMEAIPLPEPWTPARARRWWLDHPLVRERADAETVVADEALPTRRIGPAR